MSESVEHEWTMTFPVEAAVFVVTLVAIVIIGASSFFLSWGRSVPMEGGGVDQGFVVPLREAPPLVDPPMPMPEPSR